MLLRLSKLGEERRRENKKKGMKNILRIGGITCIGKLLLVDQGA